MEDENKQIYLTVKFILHGTFLVLVTHKISYCKIVDFVHKSPVIL